MPQKLAGETPAGPGVCQKSKALGTAHNPSHPKHLSRYGGPAQFRPVAPLSGGGRAVVISQGGEAELNELGLIIVNGFFPKGGAKGSTLSHSREILRRIAPSLCPLARPEFEPREIRHQWETATPNFRAGVGRRNLLHKFRTRMVVQPQTHGGPISLRLEPRASDFLREDLGS